MTSDSARKIVVVGSANLDIVVPVPKHPVRGETVLGGDHELIPGGKGANQAVAAARLGAEVVFIGRVGADPAAETLRASLIDAMVDITLLGTAADTPSGIALITVDPAGDNAIVVSPGANARLSPSDLADGSSEAHAISSAKAVLLQLEIPMSVVTRAAELATGTVILDPAPAPDGPLPPRLLDQVDILVPNETELTTLAGLSAVPQSTAEIASAARALGVPVVVVTLGERGAIIVNGDQVEIISAPMVEALDTTAAGDAFRAALAAGLVSGDDLEASVQFAVRAGAAAVLVRGAQTSLPTRADVEARLTR